MYGFLWFSMDYSMELVWDLYGLVCMNFFLWILVWRFGIPLFLCRIFVGFVVILNRGKICIEKMLGFRGDTVRFFSTHVFVLSIIWSSFIQIE